MQIPHRLRRLVAALLPIALCAVLQPVAAAERTQTANLRHVFALGSPPTGVTEIPVTVRSDLILADDGNIYFAGSAGGKGYGAIGRLAPDGSVSTVYSFVNEDEGLLPFGGIVQGTDGNLYGTTYFGGENSAGTFYKLTLGGVFTRIYQFDSGSSDPKFPYTGVVEAEGDFFGTTRLGGQFNKGTIFRITTDGVLTVLHSFNGSDGLEPQGRLTLDPSDGHLYGTTMQGGSNNRGVIYRISTTGEFQRLYSFPRLGAFNSFGLAINAAGANPKAGLLRTADGEFYGTAYQGGPNGWGTLYRAVVDGDSAEVTVVHAFEGWAFDGGKPQSVPVLGPDGNFYGTSEEGGYDSTGAVWRVTPTGTATMLHSFSASGALDTAGAQPIGSVLFANGGLLGATSTDGIRGAGYIYRIERDNGGVLPVDLTISRKNILLDEQVEISWNAPTMATCDKFGSWNEPVSEQDPNHITALTGSQAVTPFLDTVYTYGLACKDAEDVIHYAYVAVDVRAPPQETADGGEIIGGGSLSWLLLALLVALLFVKFSRRPVPHARD